MINTRALKETVTVTKPGSATGARNEYGDPVYAAGTPTNFKAFVEPMDSTEDEITRDTRIQRFKILLEPTANIDGVSTVVWRGRTLEILGEPLPWIFLGKVHHLEVDAREVLG